MIVVYVHYRSRRFTQIYQITETGYSQISKRYENTSRLSLYQPDPLKPAERVMTACADSTLHQDDQ